MGCHTYINIPVKENQDKIKQIFLNRMKEDVLEIKNNCTKKKYWVKLKKQIKVFSDHKNWDWRKLKKSYMFYYKQVQKCIDRGISHPDYKYLFKDIDGTDKDYMWYNNTIYVHQCNDFFRILWYEAPYCYSLEETIKMLECYNTKISPDEPCILSEEQKTELKQIFDSTPNAVISFH